MKEPNEPLLVATMNKLVICNKNISLQELMTCSIKETDKCTLLHVKHASNHGSRVSTKTIGNVLSIAMAACKRMKAVG